jgi:mRNA-capping enzyme
VRRKDFWLLSTVQKLLREFIKRLSHEADGLIFQGWDDPYVPRTHEGLLKWKYANLNSVDFLFEVEGERELLFVNERGKKKLMDGNKVAFKDGSEPSLYSGKIIECTWDFDNLEWIFLRIRTDKSTPNEFNTYRKVMRSIKDNITEEDLLNEINEIIRLPMYADRIKTDSKATQHANAAKRR